MKTPTLVRAAALAASVAVTLLLAQSMALYALPPGPPSGPLLAHAAAAETSAHATR